LFKTTDLTTAVHYPVLKDKVDSFLKPDKPGQLLIDATTGEGGHSEFFLKNYPDLNVICLDADNEIMDVAKNRLEPFGSRVMFFNAWFNIFFRNYPDNLQKPDRILLDLGISTFHYEKSGRGFSFRNDEELDMRLDSSLEISASDIVNSYPKDELARIIYENGEERYSRQIAGAIVKERKSSSIETSKNLADIIWNSVPPAYRHGRIHPATRTFQALRIAVNGELERLKDVLENAVSVLTTGGRLGVITFHSLEDRIVKRCFKELSGKCVCHPGVAVCACRGIEVVKILTPKPLAPERKEVEENSPSRSSKLRVVEKVGEL
jgi:16S rRNA (cytosine1402-N4)-methyltransferase